MKTRMMWVVLPVLAFAGCGTAYHVMFPSFGELPKPPDTVPASYQAPAPLAGGDASVGVARKKVAELEDDLPGRVVEFLAFQPAEVTQRQEAEGGTSVFSYAFSKTIRWAGDPDALDSLLALFDAYRTLERVSPDPIEKFRTARRAYTTAHLIGHGQSQVASDERTKILMEGTNSVPVTRANTPKLAEAGMWCADLEKRAGLKEAMCPRGDSTSVVPLEAVAATIPEACPDKEIPKNYLVPTPERYGLEKASGNIEGLRQEILTLEKSLPPNVFRFVRSRPEDRKDLSPWTMGLGGTLDAVTNPGIIKVTPVSPNFIKLVTLFQKLAVLEELASGTEQFCAGRRLASTGELLAAPMVEDSQSPSGRTYAVVKHPTGDEIAFRLGEVNWRLGRGDVTAYPPEDSRFFPLQFLVNGIRACASGKIGDANMAYWGAIITAQKHKHERELKIAAAWPVCGFDRTVGAMLAAGKVLREEDSATIVGNGVAIGSGVSFGGNVLINGSPVGQRVGGQTVGAAPWPELSAVTPGKRPHKGDAAVIVAIEKYLAVPEVPGARRNGNDWFVHLTNGLGVPVERIAYLQDGQGTVEKMRVAIKRAAEQVSSSGTLWFLFIGHGAPSKTGQDSILVGADAQQDADSLFGRSLARRDLMAMIGKGKQSRAVVMLDACFSGRSAAGAPIAPGLQPLIVVNEKARPAAKTTVLTAGTGNEFAGPLPGAERPAFSYLALGALRGWADENKNGAVTAQETVNYLQATLRAVVRGRTQTPQLSSAPKDVVLSDEATEAAPDLTRIVTGGASP